MYSFYAGLVANLLFYTAMRTIGGHFSGLHFLLVTLLTHGACHVCCSVALVTLTLFALSVDDILFEAMFPSMKSESHIIVLSERCGVRARAQRPSFET